LKLKNKLLKPAEGAPPVSTIGTATNTSTSLSNSEKRLKIEDDKEEQKVDDRLLLGKR
jgi:hypothetical protein